MEDSEFLTTTTGDVHSQSRRLSLIDVSCEDDSLIDSIAGDFKFSDDQDNRSLELFGGTAATKLDVVHENVELTDQVIQPSESVEPEVKKKKGKYNLRESIAWNSDFLSGPGVLDAEELSSMIEGDKNETRMLSGIQEEVYRSTDTISTLESDTLTLESVETCLFEDVRASIQRSSIASKVADQNVAVGSGVTEDKSTSAAKGVDSATKRVDLASQDKVRPRLASTKASIDLHKPGLLKRQASRCPQVPQSVSTSGDLSKSLLKRPKVLENPNSSSAALTKRASTGGALLKIGKVDVKSTTGRDAPVSRIPLSSRIVPKPRPSSKTSSLGVSPATKREVTSMSFNSSGSTASNNSGKSKASSLGVSPATKREVTSSFSFNSSGSTASNNSVKSPFNSKRNTDSRTSSSGSMSKTSPRIEPRNKVQSGNSLISSDMVPATKLLSSISPASSVSEWSSESSRASLDTISLKSGSLDFDAPLIMDLQNHGKDLSLVGHASQPTGLLQISMVKAPMERNGALPPSSKPSGLRLPSPKIGFFDGVKSAGSTPNGSKQPQSLVPGDSPKFGTGTVSLSGGQSKGKPGKLQPARALMKMGNKPDTQQTTSNMKPTSSVPVQHSLNAAKKVLTSSRNSISPKVDSKGPPRSGIEYQLKDKKTGAEGHGIQENCSAEKKTNVALSNDKVHSKKTNVAPSPVKAAKVTPINGESTSLCEPIATFDPDKIISSEEVGKVAAFEVHSVKHDSHSSNALKGRKESHIEEQLHDLSKQVGVMDISAETPRVLIGEFLPSSQIQQ